MKKNIEPLVSIIIPTFNSEKNINKCIQSLIKQPYKNVEIIVVDQSSSDSTREIVGKFNIKLIKLPKPKFYSPPTISRNAGAKVATGHILMHIDSDMMVSSRLIEEIVEKFKKDKDLGALIMHEQDITDGFWSRCKAFERKCYWGNDNIESARAVRKEIFVKVKGYDESLSSGEDFDIHRRYKKISKIGFCKNVLFHDLRNLSFSKTISKKYNYGKTADKYFKKNNTSGQVLLYEQAKCYLRNIPEIIRNPVIGLGSVFLKICEFGAGGLGLLVSKV